MRAEVEAIVAADEEARSRVTTAEERAKRDVASAREEAERESGDRRRAAGEALESDLAAIRAEGAQAIAALQSREAAYRQTVAAAAAARLEEAAQLYARIVIEGSPEARR